MSRTPSAFSSGVAQLEQPIPAGLVMLRPDERPEPPARDDVLAEDLFKDALARERKRTYRSERPFAVLVVEWRHTPAGERCWAPVVHAAATVKRDLDIVGWLERGAVLGVLLQECCSKTGFEVIQRLRDEIARRGGETALATLSTGLYAHDRQPGSRSAFPSVDVLLETFAPPPRRSWHDGAKRAFDIVGSLALLAIVAPLLAAIFAVIKLTSPGPALFRQTRVGRKGEPFTMLKFRSMYVNSSHAIHQDYVKWFITSSGRQPRTGNELFKLTDDPRVTRVGCFLRKTSLDELPQFWNVLRGDMSLVGPRPPLPFEVEHYQPWHRRRVLDAKPGVTGPWQVSGRSRTTFDEMVRLDLRYGRTHSLWTDIKILAATPRAMISGKGAC